jgi:hypothetical protein
VSNVDEVIKRRLLDKKTAARETLELFILAIRKRY